MSKPIKAKDYHAVRLWHALTGSKPCYIKAQQERALREGAPLDAVFWRSKGVWCTVKEVAFKDLREKLERALEEVY